MLRTKKDYKRALRVVGGVIDAWDPYDLLAMGCPADEFDPEIADIVRHLHQIDSPEKAAEVVSDVFSRWFVPRDFPVSVCEDVGARLFEAMREEGWVG